MAQKQRFAGPGTWHHVFNRGIGKRILFAHRADYRKFMAFMACAVRRGEIEIHAFSLLATHFHILCRVPNGGDLSVAMMRIQNAYARWFNRRNRRDGPLFRGRFRSKPVRTQAHWLSLLRYIDFNPVEALVCKHPAAYEFGSARAYHADRAPHWLSTCHVQALMADLFGYHDLQEGYRAMVGREPSPEERELIARRLVGPVSADPSDDLLALSTQGFQRWVVEKARHADGLKPSLPLASARALEHELARKQSEVDLAAIRRSRQSMDAWRVLRAGLLHDYAGCSCEDIARRTGRTNGTVSRWIRLHRTTLLESSDYAALATAVTRTALRRSHGRLG